MARNRSNSRGSPSYGRGGDRGPPRRGGRSPSPAPQDGGSPPPAGGMRRRRRVRRRCAGSRSRSEGQQQSQPRSEEPPARGGSGDRGGDRGGPGSRSPSRGGDQWDDQGGGSRSGSPHRRVRRRRVRRTRKSASRSPVKPPPKRSRTKSNPNDRRPRIEREKGGVKLFVGRLPREVKQSQIRECFEEFGDVHEVFIIASQAQSGVGCAFVRMGTVKAAEQAVEDLHEQRVLIPEMREMGPMQVAFAKGEATRLGLDEKEEILPSFREAKLKVEEHKEKRNFFEAVQKQQEVHQQVMEHQRAMMEQHQEMLKQASEFPMSDLVNIVKDGQKDGGQSFKQKWWNYCDQGWGGCRDYDPTRHSRETLGQFVCMTIYEYGHEDWFRSKFEDLPPLPELPKELPQMPPVPPGMGGPGMPPVPPAPPGMKGMPPMPPMPPGGKGMPPMPGMPPMGMMGMPGMMPPGMLPTGQRIPPMPPLPPSGPASVPMPPRPPLPPGRGYPPAEKASTPAVKDDESSSASEAGDIADIALDDI